MKYQELLFPLSVICILLMVKYWSSLNTITSRPWKAGELAGVNQDKGDMCSALFTVTDTPVDRMLHRYIYNLRDAASYRTNGTDWSNDDWMMGSSVVPNSQDSRAFAAAIKGVREVRLKRISPTGVSTDDYQTLSRLLPQLVFYDKISKNCEENTTKGRRGEEIIGRMVEEDNQKNGCLLVRGSSILGVTKGVLPYVPCLIASYDQRHTFSTCVRKRIEKKQSLWIHFLGDSKIRNIFQAFLNRTDSEYQYMIMYLNQTKKWRELRPLIRDDDLQYEDMEATSEAEPRMRITLSFRRFMSVSRAELQSAAEMAQLRSWASGDEVPPDLLLVGYSTWLLQRSLNLDNSHALGFMLALQKEVVPLLEQDFLLGLATVGVLMLGLLGTTAAYPGYWPQRQDPYLLQADAGNHVFKRGFWDKRAELHHNPADIIEDYPSQWTEGRLTEKRGFGSMMPVYLTHLYRPEQPILPSSALLSSTRLGWERPKTSSSSQG
ncbi:uncharacterized protein [Panulirus ornatus]|uniref:uncharacterized protein n=1 Tax=Panulirus ornatus TaxID=150431 RepID=UPI003A8BCDEF